MNFCVTSKTCAALKYFGIAICTVGMYATWLPRAESTPVTLVNQGSTWKYSVLSTDLWTSWSSVGFSTVDWGNLIYNEGTAAFSNTSAPSGGSVGTPWGASSDLALKQDFVVGGSIVGPLTLNVASDNGFVIFLNGIQVAKDNAEGFTSYWEYTLSVSGADLHPGVNTVYAFAEDHGGLTYFDMRLQGDIQGAVPEPGTMVLFGTGALGLVRVIRRLRGKG